MAVERSQIEAFFIAVGNRCEPASTLFLLGGGALELLGGASPFASCTRVALNHSERPQAARLTCDDARWSEEVERYRHTWRQARGLPEGWCGRSD